jgi:hypothetical protein
MQPMKTSLRVLRLLPAIPPNPMVLRDNPQAAAIRARMRARPTAAVLRIRPVAPHRAAHSAAAAVVAVVIPVLDLPARRARIHPQDQAPALLTDRREFPSRPRRLSGAVLSTFVVLSSLRAREDAL